MEGWALNWGRLGVELGKAGVVFGMAGDRAGEGWSFELGRAEGGAGDGS